MVASPAQDVTPATRPGPLGAEPVEVSRLVVPLDGSPFAERALPVAGWLAANLGADLHIVKVVPPSDEAEDTIRYLDATARRHQAAAWDVLEGADVGRTLVSAVEASPGRFACLATHGADQAAGPLGSVAASLLHHSSRPAVLVGPQARAVTAADARVVVAVDGTDRDASLVGMALGWAARLGRRLEIVTVAAPVAEVTKELSPPERSWGPADPETYVAELAARCEAAAVAVSCRVVYDQTGVRDGLVPLLDRTAALVVLGSRAPADEATMVLGPHAARIVHDAGVPAVTVPGPPA